MNSQHIAAVESFPAQNPIQAVAGEARATATVLVRQLDEWCRSRGASTSLNRWVADEAVRQALGQRPWLRPSRPVAEPEDIHTLPADLRHWPALWRYRVAELERRGMAHPQAMELARAEHEAAFDTTTSQCA